MGTYEHIVEGGNVQSLIQRLEHFYSRVTYSLYTNTFDPVVLFMNSLLDDSFHFHVFDFVVFTDSEIKPEWHIGRI